MTARPYQEKFFTSRDGLRLHYREYSHPGPAAPVLCLPGITRNCRDFEDIAARLGQKRRVLAADLRGRGLSQHDPNWRNYQIPTYVDDIVQLLDTLEIPTAVFFGTSLGGLLTMQLAEKHHHRIRAAILNDIGPEIAQEGLNRIKGYIGRIKPVANWEQAAAQARETYGLTWRDLTDEEWLRLARRGYRENEDGVPVLDMDPKIGDAAREVGTRLSDPWALFEKLGQRPLMVLRGEHSDILTAPIAQKMLEKNPKMTLVTVKNRGHVPLLDEPECVAAIDDFLARHAALQ